MFEVPNFLKQGEDKIKKAAKIGALTLGIGVGTILGGNKVEAQNTNQEQKEKITTNQTNINEDNKQNYSEELLNNNIKKIETELNKVKSKISLKNTDNKLDQEQLIKEYEEYLINPSLEVVKVGEVNIEQENLINDKKDYDFSKYFNRAEKNNPLELYNNKINQIKILIKQYEDIAVGCKDSDPVESKIKIDCQTRIEKENNNLKKTMDGKEDDIKSYEDARKEYDIIFDKLLKHVSSEDYLKKLTIEYEGSEDEAIKIQKSRIDNLKLGGYTISDNLNRFDWRYNEDGTIKLNSASTNLEQNETNKDQVMTHEILGHEATFAELGLSEKTKKILKEAYQENPEFFLEYAKKEKFNTSTPEKTKESLKEISEYFNNESEIYARKKNLEMEMEKLGVKKYGEKFTKDLIPVLMKLKQENKFSYSAREFLEIVKPEYLEIILNEIADNVTEKKIDNYNKA